MGVVGIVITAYRIHVGVYSLADIIAVSVESHSLPFCERLHHLGVRADLLDIKVYLSFNAVEIIVYAAALFYYERSGYAVERQRKGERLLEYVLDILYCVLCFPECERRFIPFGDI